MSIVNTLIGIVVITVASLGLIKISINLWSDISTDRKYAKLLNETQVERDNNAKLLRGIKR